MRDDDIGQILRVFRALGRCRSRALQPRVRPLGERDAPVRPRFEPHFVAVHLDHIECLPSCVGCGLERPVLPHRFEPRRDFLFLELPQGRHHGFTSGPMGLDCRLRRGGVRVERLVAVLCFCEGRREGVIVGVRNRVVLVRVAAHAFERQAEHRVADGREHVVELVVADALQGFRRRLPGIGTCHQETCRRRAGIGAGLDLVPGKLPADEISVGQVVVQRANDPVAIVICPRPKTIEFISAAFRKAHNIQPVASPAFAILGAREEPVHELPERGGRLVLEKCIQFLRRRRQSREIEECPAGEFLAAHRCGGCHARLFLLCKNETVHRGTHPCRILHSRRRHPCQGHERAEPAPLCDVDFAFCASLRTGPRVGRPHLDPLRKVRDDRFRKLRLRRHFHVGIAPPHRLYQQARVRLAQHDRRPCVAAHEHALAGIQEKPALQLALCLGLRRMAFVAGLRENRTDPLFKKCQAVRRGRRRRQFCRERHRGENNGDPPCDGESAAWGRQIEGHFQKGH